jgi:cyclopropane fatty-acyl-phospholipid synthase-like methyltransferase
MEKLTDQEYWEKYYSKSLTQKEQIISVASSYDKYWDVLINKNDNKENKTIIEIGGYPGRYLAYLSNKYNLIPTSLDFNSDKEKIEETFKSFDLKEYNIIQADFLKHKPENKYDIVISNGFIEHFNNFNEVLDKHCEYLKPGGTMLIMIPNMKYYIRFYKFLVDYKNLKIHNLKCMDTKVFKNFGKRNKLNELTNEYFGGFPFTVHQKLNIFQKIIFKIHRIAAKFCLDSFFKRYPSKYYASSIVAIYKK